MTGKITLDNKDYCIDQLSEAGKSRLAALKFVSERIQEINNHQALLQRARKSYLDSLKKEMLSDKAGFLFGDN
jgi:hypothetical protein